MKHRTAIILLLIFVMIPVFVSAQTGDGRTRAMANAFTAVVDDHNALYFNPAGLAFLKDTDFVLGMGGNVTMTKALPFGEDDYPDPWYGWHGDSGAYMYWDDFMDTDVFFDPAEYGFDYDPDIEGTGEGSYEDAVQDYIEWRNYYSDYDMMKNLSDIALFPRLAYVTRYWGVSSIYEVSLEPRETEYRAEDTVYTFDVYKDVGFMGGIGIKLWGIGVGANMKYYSRKTDVLSFTALDAVDGPPSDFFASVFFGSEEGNETVESAAHVELGIGALFALRSLNFGIYSDNLLGFVSEEGDVNVDLSILDTLSVGAALTPFNRKTSDRKGILNFIISGDLKNLGDSVRRELALGAEVGLHFGEAIMLDWRVGYRQPLPGELSTMADSFDPREGTYSVGFGSRFLLGTINATFQVPADMVFEPPQGSLSDEQMASTFGTIIVDMSLTF